MYTPEPSGFYSKNSALSGYSKQIQSYSNPSKVDYSYAYTYEQNDVYIIGEEYFDSLTSSDSYYSGQYEWDFDWEEFWHAERLNIEDNTTLEFYLMPKGSDPGEYYSKYP